MERKCCNCQKIKPLTEFYKNKKRLQYECKECTKKRITATRCTERNRDLHYRRTYGITLDDFNRMVLAQGSKCACCGASKPGGKLKNWCVDHDHVTGTVRELLCTNCNLVLGFVKDSPEHLQRLTEYVLKHSKHNQSINND